MFVCVSVWVSGCLCVCVFLCGGCSWFPALSVLMIVFCFRRLVCVIVVCSWLCLGVLLCLVVSSLCWVFCSHDRV